MTTAVRFETNRSAVDVGATAVRLLFDRSAVGKCGGFGPQCGDAVRLRQLVGLRELVARGTFS